MDEYAEGIQLGTDRGVAHKKEGENNYSLFAHIDEFFGCDLMDVYGKRPQHLFELNDGYVFALIVINAQTKMVYFRLLKTKGGVEVAKAMKEIFTLDVKPEIEGFKEVMLHSDHGKEFYNAHVATVLAGLHIHLYNSHSDHKAAVVERVIRTLRERLVNAMELKGEKWITLIARVVNLYNHAFHRSIGMSPFEATQQLPLALFRLAESRERENKKSSRGSSPRYTIGDGVSLKIQNNGWRKGTLKKFTNEVYRITRVRKTPYKYVYTVETMEHEKVFG